MTSPVPRRPVLCHEDRAPCSLDVTPKSDTSDPHLPRPCGYCLPGSAPSAHRGPACPGSCRAGQKSLEDQVPPAPLSPCTGPVWSGHLASPSLVLGVPSPQTLPPSGRWFGFRGCRGSLPSPLLERFTPTILECRYVQDGSPAPRSEPVKGQTVWVWHGKLPRLSGARRRDKGFCPPEADAP